MSDIQQSRDFVLEQAKLNIERVSTDKTYVEQAKQVNSSLAAIVAMERNSVMLEAIRKHKDPPCLPSA